MDSWTCRCVSVVPVAAAGEGTGAGRCPTLVDGHDDRADDEGVDVAQRAVGVLGHEAGRRRLGFPDLEAAGGCLLAQGARCERVQCPRATHAAVRHDHVEHDVVGERVG